MQNKETKEQVGHTAPVGGEGEGWEVLSFIEVDGVGVSVAHTGGKLVLTVSGKEEYVGELPIEWLLAKAREEGVREGRALEGKEWSDAVKRNLRP